ncbi:MAG: DUF169 domain-containing protein [Bryobacteraceae bacterium]
MNPVQQILGLNAPPIAIAFLQQPPPGVRKWESAPVPAGCNFWRIAMDGKTFYTVPSDHYNCAVGSHTHAIPLPPDRAKELEDTVGFMVANRYIEMKEVPGIPVLKESPAVVAYGPAGEVPFAADVVVIAAAPAQAMLLYEAAVRAGAGNALTNVLGRPGCAALPLTKQSDVAALSFGCKGNRTFVGLADSEMYFMVPGGKWEAVSAQLASVAGANAAMAGYYNGRREQFPIL